jgi:hypothetical protein
VKRAAPYTSLALVMGGLVASGILGAVGCGLLLELDVPNTHLPPEPEAAFLCTAEIYRDIGESREFTEAWELFAFPPKTCSAGPFQTLSCTSDSDCDGHACAGPSPTDYCAAKLDHYESNLLAPGLAWQHRDFGVTEIPITPEVLSKAVAVDCPNLETVGPSGPPGFGAPCGNELTLTGADQTEDVFVRVRLTQDGHVYPAEPAVESFTLRFAERTGLPARPPAIGYLTDRRNLRFADLFIRLEVPFSLGPLQVNRFYIQSIGTIVAEEVGTGAFRIFGGDAKFYLSGSAAAEGEAGEESFCFTADGVNPETVQLAHGAGGVPFFGFGFNLFPAGGLQVDIGFSTTVFDAHQPFVALADRPDERSMLVDLAPLILADPDGDASATRVLWFEDFEEPSERFLGQGASLSDVAFEYGDHEVSVVAYDERGCFNTGSMTLTITNVAPVAVEDEYAGEEDALLEVPAPGVLTNDRDANPTDVLTASLQSAPAHGDVELRADGSFTYSPDPNYVGSDGFTYVARDAALESSAATVFLTITEVEAIDEIDRTRDEIGELLEEGVLTEDEANALDSKLAKAQDELERMHPNAERSACGKLGAFVNQVLDLLGQGVLTEEQARGLIEGAEVDVGEELGCR